MGFMAVAVVVNVTLPLTFFMIGGCSLALFVTVAAWM
jgi:hypothetical protein